MYILFKTEQTLLIYSCLLKHNFNSKLNRNFQIIREALLASRHLTSLFILGEIAYSIQNIHYLKGAC